MGELYVQALIALHEIHRHRWFALAVAAAICLIGWTGVSFIPNRYVSEARIFVQLQTLLPDNIGMSIAARQKAVDRVKRTLTSTVNIERVIRSTDLINTLPNDRDVTAAAEELRKQISVVEQHENLFLMSATVGFRGYSDVQNARLARVIVQKLIDIFVEDNLSGDRQETSQSISFLDKQIDDARAKMDEADTARAEFERATFGELPGSGSLSDRLAEARRELSDLDFEILTAQSAVSQSAGQAADVRSAANLGSDPAAAIKAQINDALARGWTENHPDIVALRRQLARLGPGGKAGDTGRGAPTYLRALAAERQGRLSALLARKQQLQSQLSRSVSQSEARPDIAAEQDRLNRTFETVREQYATLLSKRENLKLQDQVISTTDTVSFRVIDPPSSPRRPALPDRPLLLLAVAFLAAAGGVGAALLRSIVLRTFPTAQRLATATGIPVIAMVPDIGVTKGKQAVTRQDRLFRFAVGLLVSALSTLIVIDEAQRSILA